MKIAMLFPGYSSQFVGMGKELYDDHRIMQEYFEEASNCLNMNFVKLCFASSDAELSKLHNAYPALFLVNTAIARLLHDEGIVPNLVAGYCDGEYAALTTAGSISFPDGLYLLLKHSNFYEEMLRENELVALRVSSLALNDLENFCSKVREAAPPIFVAIAHDHSDHIVVGYAAAIDMLKTLITGNQHSLEYVGIGLGGHSSIMDGVVNHLRMYLEKVDFRDLKLPFISQLDGKQIYAGSEVKQRVLQIINSPITFIPLLDTLAEYDIIVEIGNKTPLHKNIKQHYPDKPLLEIKKNGDIQMLKSLLKI